MPGFGLPSQFHEIFVKLSPERQKQQQMERLYANKKNQQIRIDQNFCANARTEKKKEEQLFKEMEGLLNPIKSLVDVEMINKSLKDLNIYSEPESDSEVMPTGDS